MAGRESGAAEAADDDWDAVGRRYPLNFDFRFALDHPNFSDKVLRLEIVPGDSFAGKFSLPSTRHRFFRRALASEGVDQGNAGEGVTLQRPDPDGLGKDLPPHQVITMPSVISTMTQGKITNWVKKEGDKVSVGEPLCEVEVVCLAEAVDAEKPEDSSHQTIRLDCLNEGYIAKIVQGDGAKEINVGEIICLTVQDEGNIEKFKDYIPSPIMMTMTNVKDNRVRDIRLNSAVVAAHSSVFFVMFSNGMQETGSNLLTYVISESEEEVLLEVIAFLYSGTLSTTDPCMLLDILNVADLLGVPLLIKHALDKLALRSMNMDYALLCLDYPYNPAVIPEVTYLTTEAKSYIVSRFKFLDRSIPEEFWGLPLVAVEAVFESSSIHVESEDAVYDILVKWLSEQYSSLEHRTEVWRCNLVPLIRFNFMSHIKLEEISAIGSSGLHGEETLKRINSALIGCRATLEEREYLRKPITTVQFPPCYNQIVVHLDLTREQCKRLYPDGQIYSHAFSFAGTRLHLMATCERSGLSNYNRFAFWLGKCSADGDSVTVNVEFAYRTKANLKFVTKKEQQNVFLDGTRMAGGPDLFEHLFEPWLVFIADDELFVDGALRMRVDVTLVQ